MQEKDRLMSDFGQALFDCLKPTNMYEQLKNLNALREKIDEEENRLKGHNHD